MPDDPFPDREQCWIIATTERPSRVAELAGRSAELAREHHAYIHQLDRDGLLVLHGASRDERGTRQGTGFIVIRSATRTEAERIAVREPYIACGARILNLIPWQVYRPAAG